MSMYEARELKPGYFHVVNTETGAGTNRTPRQDVAETVAETFNRSAEAYPNAHYFLMRCDGNGLHDRIGFYATRIAAEAALTAALTAALDESRVSYYLLDIAGYGAYGHLENL